MRISSTTLRGVIPQIPPLWDRDRNATIRDNEYKCVRLNGPTQIVHPECLNKVCFFLLCQTNPSSSENTLSSHTLCCPFDSQGGGWRIIFTSFTLAEFEFLKRGIVFIASDSQVWHPRKNMFALLISGIILAFIRPVFWGLLRLSAYYIKNYPFLHVHFKQCRGHELTSNNSLTIKNISFHPSGKAFNRSKLFPTE